MDRRRITRREAIKAASLSAAGLSLGGFGTARAVNDHERGDTLGLSGKVAFVTGGARGIGLSIAEELARQGVHVVLFDIAGDVEGVPYPLATMDDLTDARQKVEAHGVRCLAMQGDVRHLGELERAVATTAEEFGQLDIAIANAGVTRAGDVQSHTEHMMQVLVDTNLGGVAKTIKAATPLLKTQPSGRIVAIGSIAGRGGADKFPIYAATKWGVIGLAKSVAIELGEYGITCNAICPGWIETELSINDHMLQLFGGQNASENKQRLAAFLDEVTPLPGGLLDPVEVARVAVFLCSEAAGNITGSVIDVTAGWNAGNTA